MLLPKLTPQNLPQRIVAALNQRIVALAGLESQPVFTAEFVGSQFVIHAVPIGRTERVERPMPAVFFRGLDHIPCGQKTQPCDKSFGKSVL